MNNSSVDTIINSLYNKLEGKKVTQREKYYIEHLKLLSSLRAQNNLENQNLILDKIALIKEMALANAAKVINGLSIPAGLYHRHNMLIYGIHVENEDFELQVAVKRKNFESETRYKQFEISFNDEGSIKLRLVPLRICQKPKNQTPYVYTKNGNIEYYGLRLDLQQGEIRTSQKAKRYSGFYFPHLTAATKHNPREAYYELRINPITQKSCPGNCLFCERLKSMPTEEEMGIRYYYSPEELVERIFSEHSQDVLKYVQYYKIITETFGSEEKCLDYLLSVRKILTKHGCKGRLYFVGNDIRSKAGINIFHDQIDDEIFAFTVEAFTRRNELMSKYKAIPMEEIYQILHTARNAKFKKIHINYIEGLDSLEEFRAGIARLAKENLIDAIGHNIMQPFASFQERLLVPESKDIEYYLQVRAILDEFNIKSHHPATYEKGGIFSNDIVFSNFKENKFESIMLTPEKVYNIVSGKND